MKRLINCFFIVITIFLFQACDDSKNTNFEKLVIDWNTANNSKDIVKLSRMYDEVVLYYNVNKSRNDCIENKLEFFSRHTEFTQDILGRIEVENVRKNEVKCKFTKRVNLDENIKDYPSYLVFKEVNQEWKIVSESDLVTDNYFNKKIQGSINSGEETKKNIVNTYKSDINKLYIENNNIFIEYKKGKSKQITFNGSDENPIFVNKKREIIFIRNIKESGAYHNYVRKKLMIVSVNDLKERVITDKKPYKDGLDNSDEIFNIHSPTLSFDEKSVYFTTEKWATANELVNVNIESGKWKELFSANYFEIIQNGIYKGDFLIVRSEIRDRGRDGYFMIVNKKGEVLKDFENRESAEAFLNVVE